MANSDRCTAGLEIAAYNRTKMAKSGEFSSDIYKLYESSKFRDYVRSQGFGFSTTIPLPDGLPPVTLGYSSSDQEFDEFQARIKAIEEQKFKQAFSLELVQTLVSSEFIEAYKLCLMNPDETDIGGNVTVSDDFVTVQIWFNRKYEKDALPTIRSVWCQPLIPVIDAANPKVLIKQGASVPDGSITQRYAWPINWPEGKAADIHISTTRGPFWRRIVKQKVDDPLPDPRRLLITYEMSEEAGKPQQNFGPIEETIARGETKYYPGPGKDDTFGAGTMQARVSVDDEGGYEVAVRTTYSVPPMQWRSASKIRRGSADASGSWCHIRVRSLD